MLTASAWMIAMRWAMRGIGLISTIVIARILAPQDFGIIAMGMVVVGLLETLSFLGVDLVLIQRDDVTRAHFDTAWTISILQGLLIAAILVGAAPIAADAFSEPRVTPVIMVLALRSIIGGFENVGTISFRRDLNFAKDFRFGVYKKLVSFAITVGCALVMRNYWALAVGMVAGRLVEVALSYQLHPYRPRFSLSEWHSVWSFSKWLFILNLGYYARNRADEMVVGYLSGTTAMGQYHIGAYVATSCGEEVALPLARALFPNFARQASTPELLMQSCLRMMRIIAPVVISISFGMIAVAHDMVLVVLGEKWLGAVPIVQALALYSAIFGISHGIFTLSVAVGRVRLMAVITILQGAVLFLGCLGIGALYGVEAVAVTRTVIALVTMPILFYVMTKLGPVSLGQLVETFWRPLVASIVMVAIVWALHAPGIDAPTLRLLLDVSVGATVYALTSLLLWRVAGRPDGLERLVLRQLRII